MPSELLRRAGVEAVADSVLMDAARENRERMCAALRRDHADAVVFLRSGEAEMRHSSDHELLFRQESFFHHITAVREPDCAVIVRVADAQ